MKKLINSRYPLVCALAIILGIFCAYKIYFGKVIFAVVTFAVAVLIMTLLALFGGKKFVSAILFVVVAVLAFVRTEVAFVPFTTQQVIQRQVILEGRVCDIGRNGEKLNVLYLEDCTDITDGTHYRGRIKLAVYNGQDYDTGDTVIVSGLLSTAYRVKNDVDTTFVRRNVKYEFEDGKVQAVKNGKLKLDESIRLYIYDCCQSYAPQTADVAYSLLTGDRNALDNLTETAFVRAGIIHLLAVSGLHVGFVVAVLCFAVKRFRLRPLLELAVLLVPLGFYAYVCAFTPSVIRAIVMLCCVYVSRALFGRSDTLSSLSVASVIILSVQPLYLFDVGFQLSAMSVYGIATLYSATERLCNKRKISKYLRKVISAVGVSVSCTVATLFCVALNYGQVSLVGVAVNLVAIPLISLAFVLFAVGLLPWVFHYVLTLGNYVTYVVVQLAKWVASWNYSVVQLPSTVIAVIITLIIMFVLGGYVNIGKLAKWITCCVLITVLATSVVLSALPKHCTDRVDVFAGYSDNTVVVMNSYGEVAIITNCSDGYNVQDIVDYVNGYGYGSCILYLHGLDNADVAVVQTLSQNIFVDKCYLLDTALPDFVKDNFAERSVSVIHVPKNQLIGERIKVQNVYDGALAGIVMSLDNVTVAKLVGGEVVCNNFTNVRNDVDLYVTNTVTQTFADKNLPTIGKFQTNYLHNYGANKYGHFTITQKDGKIVLSFD